MTAIVGALAIVAIGFAPAWSLDLPTPRLRVALGYHFSTGDYGTGETTEITYVPLTARLTLGNWSLQAVVPYLHIASEGALVEGPAGPVRTTAGSEDGVGDVITRATYSVPPRWPGLPWVDLVGSIKLPTASRRRGLGTGKVDYGIGTELVWTWGRVTPFAGIGYRILAGTRTTPLHDTVEGTIGGQVRVSEGVQLGALVDWRQAASASNRERLEVVPFVTWTRSPTWSLNLHLSTGLRDGSPDVGTGIEIAFTR